jgi:hypothetical protein
MTGKSLEHFPVRVHGRLQSQPLLINLDGGVGLHVVVAALDGQLYFIEGTTGCADRLDLGESAYTMVLADDITGSGRLELLATTRTGHAYLLSTDTPFHPLNAWYAMCHGFTVTEPGVQE